MSDMTRNDIAGASIGGLAFGALTVMNPIGVAVGAGVGLAVTEITHAKLQREKEEEKKRAAALEKKNGPVQKQVYVPETKEHHGKMDDYGIVPQKDTQQQQYDYQQRQ